MSWRDELQIDVITISLKYKNSIMANFVLTGLFKIRKTIKVCNLEK